jgi:TolB-like protein
LFEDFVLDTERRELRRGAALLSMEPQVFDLLEFLVRNRDRVVTKDDLLASVWGGRIVSESTLGSRINAARRVIGDTGEQQRLIRTIIGKGVRFVGKSREQQDTDHHDAPLVTPRLSIVVLPFTNLSDDQEQQYFADGITEDLTTDLSRIAHSCVISRNTAFTYRNKPIDTKQIGRELRVRYVLEGSVRRLGNRVRVSAQLIDAATDAHVWADRFDSVMGDLFALQNEITSRIAIALNLELVLAEATRPADNPDAFDYVIRGRAALSRGPTRANYSEAINLFERALELDPHSVEAKSLLATALGDRVLNHMTETAETDLIRAERLVTEALKRSTRSALSYYAKGQLLRARSRHEEAIPEYEAVLALDHNCVAALAALGECKLYIGCIEQIIPLEEQAIRLSPRDPLIAVWNWWIGLAHLL